MENIRPVKAARTVYRAVTLGCWAAAFLVLAGCERTVTIRGSVVDVRGDHLPGVAVTVQGAEVQTLTDPRGLYTLHCAPGPLTLQFLKTDYTPGRLELNTGEARVVDATEVLLWPLPSAKGVYFFEGGRYEEAARVTPKRFTAKDLGAVLGTRTNPELATLNPQPLIVCYKLPPYDVRLDRLRQVETTTAAPPKKAEEKGQKTEPSASPAETVWVPAEPLTVIATPIDEPDRLLVELRPTVPLPPGVYAAHWGAFDGHMSTDPNVYLFRIAEAAPPEAEGDASEPAAEENTQTAPPTAGEERPAPKP
jgi:hypothetical protein